MTMDELIEAARADGCETANDLTWFCWKWSFDRTVATLRAALTAPREGDGVFYTGGDATIRCVGSFKLGDGLTVPPAVWIKGAVAMPGEIRRS